ncbi:MAG: hypothetical protein R6W96_03285 [Clostridia bacterium]
MEQKWFKLDNAAKIYPAVREREWAPIYRLDCMLRENVDPKVLDSALQMTYRRFPTFSVSIRKGLFWYFLEENQSRPQVRLETAYPTEPFSEEKDRGFHFRVLYFRKRISLEVFHSLADGYGSLVFLKTLVFNYFLLSREEKPKIDYSNLEEYGILYYKDLPTEEETEDSFLNYAEKKQALNLKEHIPFKIPGTRFKRHSLRITHVVLSVRQVIDLSKRYGSTITQFLTALYIHAISMDKKYRVSSNKLIKISVPINLRKAFPSKTLRNFSSYINIAVSPGQDMDFQTICDQVRNQMTESMDPKLLRMKFSGNVNAEKKIMTRLAPLFIKKFILRTYYSRYGDRIVTSVLSNMGNTTLPDYMEDFVERFDAVLGRPQKNSINSGVMSYRDTISITFSSVILENTILKAYIDFLTSHEVDVKVETNY